MATYYQYQNPSEIGAAPTLDWGTVISNVNETLQKQEQQRFNNREEDKRITNEILQKANEVTASSDPNFGAIMQKTTDQIKNNTFARYNLLREGKINRSDYSIFKQNTQAGIAQLDAFSKGWNKTYTDALELRKQGKTTDQANALQDILGGFQNFKDKKLIQGDDGFLYTASIDPKTGSVLNSAIGIMPMQALTNVKNFTDLRINLQDEVNKYAKDIKPVVEVWMRDKKKTVEDLRQMDAYKELKQNIFNGIAVNDNVIGDILTTYGDYKVDLNLANSDPKAKKMTVKQSNGSFVSDITPEMRDEAMKIVENQLLSQTGYKEEARTEFAPREVKPGKEPKYGPKTIGDVSVLKDPGTDNVRGVSIGVGGVVIPLAKGVEERVDAISYDRGKLRMKVTKVSGTETDEITTGEETGTGSVKIGEGKKNIKEKVIILDTGKNRSTMSVLIKQIPHPNGKRNWSSLEEAEKYLKDAYQRELGVSGGGSNVPSATRNEWKANGWSDAQIDAAVKQGKIKVN